MKKLKIGSMMIIIVMSQLMIMSCGGKDDADSSKDANEIRKTKDWIESQRQWCYMLCSEYVDDQIKLEQIRTNPNKVHSLSSTSDEIEKTWDIAYRTIMSCNSVLDNLNRNRSLYSDQDYNTVSIHARAVRAFVYYNVAMLWGYVPLVKTLTDNLDDIQPIPQSAIYSFANNEINEIVKISAELNMEDESQITKDALRMIKAEIEMTLKNTNGAFSALNQIDRKKYEEDISNYRVPVIWILNPPYASSSCYVYTYSHTMLYEKEILGEIEKIETSWKSESHTEYGYWAALKRLGKAQTITGCHDYELLMPYPNSYISSSKKAVQNPGYKTN